MLEWRTCFDNGGQTHVKNVRHSGESNGAQKIVLIPFGNGHLAARCADNCGTARKSGS